MFDGPCLAILLPRFGGVAHITMCVTHSQMRVPGSQYRVYEERGELMKNFLANLACWRLDFLAPWLRAAGYRLLSRTDGCPRNIESSTPVCPRAVHPCVHERYTRVTGNLFWGVEKKMKIEAKQLELFVMHDNTEIGIFFIDRHGSLIWLGVNFKRMIYDVEHGGGRVRGRLFGYHVIEVVQIFSGFDIAQVEFQAEASLSGVRLGRFGYVFIVKVVEPDVGQVEPFPGRDHAKHQVAVRSGQSVPVVFGFVVQVLLLGRHLAVYEHALGIHRVIVGGAVEFLGPVNGVSHHP